MIHNKKEFMGGLALLGAFFAVLIVMFQPLFNGQNAMAYLDDLYNSISKGSAYYVEEMRKEAYVLNDDMVDLKLNYQSSVVAMQSAAMMAKSGVAAVADDKTVTVKGSLGEMLAASLDDADLMYNNDKSGLEGKYGTEPRRVMYNWWVTYNQLDKALKKDKSFAAAKAVGTIQQKAIEASYNYYEVEPLKIADKLWTVIFSLVFYVFYTLWFGFAILFTFEGWGLKLSH